MPRLARSQYSHLYSQGAATMLPLASSDVTNLLTTFVVPVILLLLWNVLLSVDQHSLPQTGDIAAS